MTDGGGGRRARDNPFAAQRIDRLPWRPPAGGPGGDECSLDDLLARFAALGHRAALVGPKGRGKTTLLETLGRRLEAQGLTVRRLVVTPHRRPPRAELHRFLAAPGRRDLLLLDGYDHLTSWTRHHLHRAASRAAGLLVAAHHPRRLPVLLHCTSTPALLRELIDELLSGREAPVPMPSAEELYRRHAGNLRLALRELYDRWAGRPSTGGSSGIRVEDGRRVEVEATTANPGSLPATR